MGSGSRATIAAGTENVGTGLVRTGDGRNHARGEHGTRSNSISEYEGSCDDATSRIRELYGSEAQTWCDWFEDDVYGAATPGDVADARTSASKLEVKFRRALSQHERCPQCSAGPHRKRDRSLSRGSADRRTADVRCTRWRCRGLAEKDGWNAGKKCEGKQGNATVSVEENAGRFHVAPLGDSAKVSVDSNAENLFYFSHRNLDFLILLVCISRSGSWAGFFVDDLKQEQSGKKLLLDAVIPQVYDELRRLAASYISREREGHTLQPTALVNETYMRMISQHSVDFSNRAHLLGVAAQMMRRILRTYDEGRNAEKRGGDFTLIRLSDSPEPAAATDLAFSDVDEVLNRMAEMNERLAKVAELRIFGGLSTEETAEYLEISVATVYRDWTSGKLWLARELKRKTR